MIGQSISHYKILAKLGEGGMGVVYKAEDTKLKRPVALKFLPAELTRDEDAKERFIHEAQAASGLDHPNICNIHEINATEDGQLFIVMAYYEGETLQEKVDSGSLIVDSAIDVAIQIAQGLVKAHAHGIVHRDLKPANIIVTKDGMVKIVDFGLALLTDRSRLTKTGSTVGTMAYMSPEQARGERVDHRTDIWALGVVVYEMLAGQLPFKGEYEHAVMYSILNVDPDPITGLHAGVPTAVESIVHKALQKRPGERYQSVEALLSDLKRVGNGLEAPMSTSWSDILGKALHKKRINRAVAAAGMALLLVWGFLRFKPVVFQNEELAAPKPIAVIKFENQTGDSTYNYLQSAIPSLLITSLEQSQDLQVTTWERMRDLLKQMGKDKVKTIDSDLGFELCRMDGVEVIVLGSFVKAGEVFATNVRVLDVNTKKTLKSASARGEGVASILKTQIDALGVEISRGIGLSERSIQTTQIPIAEVTTTSMEAYQFYIGGREYAEQYYDLDAIRLLEKAVEYDSTFASAYLLLSGIYQNWRDPVKSVKMLEKAKRHSQRASGRERLFIESSYSRRIEQNPLKADSLLEQIVLRFPKEVRARGNLAGRYLYRRMYDEAIEEFNQILALNPNFAAAHNALAYAYANKGDFDNAMGSLQRAIALSPGSANPLDTMAEIYLAMGKVDAAIAKFKEVQAIKPDFPGVDWRLAYCFALKEDYPAALKSLDQHLAMYPGEVFYFCMRGFYRYFQGHAKYALNDLRQAYDLAGSRGDENFLREIERVRGWLLYDQGEFDPGVTAITKLTNSLMEADPRGRPFHQAYRSFCLGMVHIKRSQVDSAKHQLEMIKSILPLAEREHEEQPKFHHDLLSAEILLAEGSAGNALAVIQKMAFPRIHVWLDADATFRYNVPFRNDLLARTHLQLGDLDGAIAEYERLTIVDPQNNDRRLIPARFHYKMAKLYEQKGMNAKAIERYERFIKVWKDADQDWPELSEARARLAELQRKRRK
ncbi:MAG: protein kinase domain-containing protein [bacterium]